MENIDSYRRATRDEFELAVEWAAAEDWNPGVRDADIFWETDPEGFVCVERNGEVIGTGSIVSYGSFGFMGFFIVRPDLRGQGIGRDFWHWRRDQLLSRLEPAEAIGMDGVFAMQPFYAKGGFVFSHRNLRLEGVGEASEILSQVQELAQFPIEWLLELDRECFGVEREAFVRRWVAQDTARCFGVAEGSALSGYGVIRKCLNGHKIGPLFARSAEVAEALFNSLSRVAAGESIYLDVPENNQEALALASRHGMTEIFGCARMYHGPAPKLPWQNIYGVTTFELG